MTNDKITTLPLSQLRIDTKANVRHINRGLDPVLYSSIKALGQLQPLNVRPNGKGYLVYAGGQRLLALQEIAKERKTPDMDVKVIVGDGDDASSREASLHENVARSAMHPVDEYRAYSTLHNDKDHPLSVEQIAERFGVTPKGVHQRLALGALDDSVLNAWQAGEIDARIARHFTMVADKKAQKAALERARTGFLNEHNVREALGIGQERRLIKALGIIGEDAYVARGGKIMRDLFADDRSDNTTISDPELVKTMVEELLNAEVSRLQADGWGVVTRDEASDMWAYPRIEITPKPTKQEAARLKEIEKILRAAEEADEYPEDVDSDALDDEEGSIKQAIETRALASIDAKNKAKGIAFVALDHHWSKIEITFRKQKPATKAAAGGSTTEAKKAKAAKPEDAISQALLHRQAEQLTAAAQVAIVKQPNVALAVLIASLTSSSEAVQISGRSHDRSMPKFDATLASALKMTQADQVRTLATLTARNITLFRSLMREPVLADPHFMAVASAIDGKALTAATREKFDAKDFFASVSRSTIVEAVREAMGDEHARKVAKMDKAAATKFATANLPKLKWLPKQLRVEGYDGPAAKAKKAKR